jgi:hypothetical protein
LQTESPRELDLEEPQEDLDKLLDMVLDIPSGPPVKTPEKSSSKKKKKPRPLESPPPAELPVEEHLFGLADLDADCWSNEASNDSIIVGHKVPSRPSQLAQPRAVPPLHPASPDKDWAFPNVRNATPNPPLGAMPVVADLGDGVACPPSPPQGPAPAQADYGWGGARVPTPTSALESRANSGELISAPAGLKEYDPVTQLAVQAYIAINVAPTYGQSPESLGPAHVFKAYTGLLTKTSTTAETVWLGKLPELEELSLRAFRYALKITIDCVAMGEDASAMEDKELEAELRTLEDEWHLGVEGAASWQGAMEQCRPYLMAMRKQPSSAAYQVVRLCLNQDKVRVAELRSEVVQSIWASASMELRYFTNDDDERYSIQAHPTLLRNMIVQSAEYPIFAGPPTTVWL